jgi:hypothetical protein
LHNCVKDGRMSNCRHSAATRSCSNMQLLQCCCTVWREHQFRSLAACNAQDSKFDVLTTLFASLLLCTVQRLPEVSGNEFKQGLHRPNTSCTAAVAERLWDFNSTLADNLEHAESLYRCMPAFKPSSGAGCACKQRWADLLSCVADCPCCTSTS